MPSPERQSARMSKIKNSGLDSMAKCKALTESAVKGLTGASSGAGGNSSTDVQNDVGGELTCSRVAVQQQ